MIQILLTIFLDLSVAAPPLHLLLQPGQPALTSVSDVLSPSSGLRACLCLFLVHFISIHLHPANSYFILNLNIFSLLLPDTSGCLGASTTYFPSTPIRAPKTLVGFLRDLFIGPTYMVGHIRNISLISSQHPPKPGSHGRAWDDLGEWHWMLGAGAVGV